ncbi:non-hydrolyzing UDP-N-acetylglucosamine 2-epimerase [Parahaliea aestuarii]|uniref:UDP-N-acetylglucosamine 2-epimerase (Non-hydrolyzing) n=1 Tax=Parahaliea aestuarii TaxID=1852021 RepID=A0A5C9A3L7_9GAMM|nr:UDP-N-acetylglucosamine 2-epimerase (non-hydrolyzing) [Parahaliea aestuarii]TXS94532.1 UDP-N-acetylglucosamine 2-epimerase (non-hydrolyzing) [Parahaliea aestuarii]
MKVCTVIGARPQFVKASVVTEQFMHAGVEEYIVHTGQHFDKNMSNIFFSELGLRKPWRHLAIGGGSHGQNTGRMIEGIESALLDIMPDWVLVYGDTDSTLAGTIAAVKLHIPVAHVEAGLRSYNRSMPEEINRVLTDHASALLFSPTLAAVENLQREGISGESVLRVGDVMYDVALKYGSQAGESSRILQHLKLLPAHYILATIHRQENTDDLSRLKCILEALSSSSEKIVLPLHPRTKSRIQEFQLSLPDNVMCIEPVGYLDMVMLEKNAAVIVTDSGGVQKEAFFYRVPCITLRAETEWRELVELGWNTVVEPKSVEPITKAIEEAKSRPGNLTARPFGDGNAASLIAKRLACSCN